jgi:hypothetical protein
MQLLCWMIATHHSRSIPRYGSWRFARTTAEGRWRPALLRAKMACVKKLNSQNFSNRSLLSSRLPQIFYFLFFRNRDYLHAVPPHTRGVSRSSRTSGAGCGGRVDAAAWLIRADEQRRCARSSRAVLIPRRWYHARDDASHHTGNGGQKARRTGENAKQPFHPSRGECRVFSAEPVVTAACFFAAGGPWVRPAPGIPCALVFLRAVRPGKARAWHAATTRNRVLRPPPSSPCRHRG